MLSQVPILTFMFKGIVSDHMRISKSQNIFARGYTSHWSEEAFWSKK